MKRTGNLCNTKREENGFTDSLSFFFYKNSFVPKLFSDNGTNASSAGACSVAFVCVQMNNGNRSADSYDNVAEYQSSLLAGVDLQINVLVLLNAQLSSVFLGE